MALVMSFAHFSNEDLAKKCIKFSLATQQIITNVVLLNTMNLSPQFLQNRSLVWSNCILSSHFHISTSSGLPGPPALSGTQGLLQSSLDVGGIHFLLTFSIHYISFFFFELGSYSLLVVAYPCSADMKFENQWMRLTLRPF